MNDHDRGTEAPRSKPDFDDNVRRGDRETRALWAHEIPPDLLQALAEARVDPRHDHLDAMDLGTPAPLSASEIEALDRSEAAAALGDFATDDEVRAVWAKHGF